MKNYDALVKIYQNPNENLYILDHPYRILIIDGSGSGKTNVLMNLINMNDQMLIKPTYKWSIKMKVSIFYQRTRKSRDQTVKTFKNICWLSTKIIDVYENPERYKPARKIKVLIVFGDITADVEANKILSHIVTKLFISVRKLNISLVVISKSYLTVWNLIIRKSYFLFSKDIILNGTHYFIMNIPNKRELQQIISNNSSDIKLKDFMKLYKDYIKNPASF